MGTTTEGQYEIRRHIYCRKSIGKMSSTEEDKKTVDSNEIVRRRRESESRGVFSSVIPTSIMIYNFSFATSGKGESLCNRPKGRNHPLRLEIVESMTAIRGLTDQARHP